MDDKPNNATPPEHWLRYALSPSIKPAIRRQFLQHFHDPAGLAELLLQAQPVIATKQSKFNTQATELLKERFSQNVEERVAQQLEWAARSPLHHLVGLDHPAYPKDLLLTQNPPPMLYIRGKLNTLQTPCVAIVGARKATHSALEHTHQLAFELAQAGITVVSGLALGIDAAAHRGCLAGTGETIAIAATAPDRLYPAQHHALAHDIQEHGAIITEFPLGTPLRPHCFPRRNRIISGISLGVIVMEAALPSGTLTTAKHAIEQGREVMAVPGSVFNPNTRGNHALIKDGAALVESTADILSCLEKELRGFTDTKPVQKTLDYSSTEPQFMHTGLASNNQDALTLLKCIGFDPVRTESIRLRSGFSSAKMNAALTQLELEGMITLESGGRYARCKTKC